MSTENASPTPAACSCATPAAAEQGSCCGCSHKKWLVLLLILVVGAGIAWVVVQQIGGNLRATEAYQAAMQKIQNFPALKEELGQPITDSWRTAGRSEPNEVDLIFAIQGPKGAAKVHAHGKPIQGKWALDILDVTVNASGKMLKLLEGDDEGDAPRFEGPKPVGEAQTQGNAPAPEINLVTPPGDAPGQK
jgi:hypothetical protein